jgi:hypothetical protein
MVYRGRGRRIMKEKTILTIVGILSLVIVIFLGFRFFIVTQGYLTYHDVCKLEYGENWTYEYSDVYGKTCAEVDYLTFNTINRKAFIWSNEVIFKKYCHRPSFWDLRNWDAGCMTKEA